MQNRKTRMHENHPTQPSKHSLTPESLTSPPFPSLHRRPQFITTHLTRPHALTIKLMRKLPSQPLLDPHPHRHSIPPTSILPRPPVQPYNLLRIQTRRPALRRRLYRTQRQIRHFCPHDIQPLEIVYTPHTPLPVRDSESAFFDLGGRLVCPGA